MNPTNPMNTMNTMNTPVVIERSHPSQTVAGLALLNQLANAPQGCSFDALFHTFCQAKGDAQPPATASNCLRNLLGHMARRGQVAIEGSSAQRRYHFGGFDKLPTTEKSRAAKAATLAATARARAAACASASAGQRVPPSQYDVMYGPVYAPPRGPALRPGSLDFKRCPSHGYGC